MTASRKVSRICSPCEPHTRYNTGSTHNFGCIFVRNHSYLSNERVLHNGVNGFWKFISLSFQWYIFRLISIKIQWSFCSQTCPCQAICLWETLEICVNFQTLQPLFTGHARSEVRWTMGWTVIESWINYLSDDIKLLLIGKKSSDHFFFKVWVPNHKKGTKYHRWHHFRSRDFPQRGTFWPARLSALSSKPEIKWGICCSYVSVPRFYELTDNLWPICSSTDLFSAFFMKDRSCMEWFSK